MDWKTFETFLLSNIWGILLLGIIGGLLTNYVIKLLNFSKGILLGWAKNDRINFSKGVEDMKANPKIYEANKISLFIILVAMFTSFLISVLFVFLKAFLENTIDIPTYISIIIYSLFGATTFMFIYFLRLFLMIILYLNSKD